MATSGVDVLTKTADAVIKNAFLLINVLPATATLQAADLAYATDVLNEMIQDWTMDGVTPWRKQTATFTPVQGQAEYALTQRPLEIIELRWGQAGGTDLPLEEIEHDEYFDLPVKDTEGTPTQFYFRRDRITSTIFVWPTPHVITTELFRLTYDRRMQIVVDPAVDEIDVPQEWLSSVTYNLAARLADPYGANGPSVDRVIMRSAELFEKAKAFERQGSVAMYPEEIFY